MKKLISCLFAIIFVLASFTVLASAENEETTEAVTSAEETTPAEDTDEEDSVKTEDEILADMEEAREETIYLAQYGIGDSDRFLRISFKEQFVSFGENISITTSDDMYGKDKPVVYSGSQLICLTEKTGTGSDAVTSPVIYVPQITETRGYIVIPAGTVIDADGKGNKETVVGGNIYGLFTENEVRNSGLKKIPGITVATGGFPVDFYLEDKPVSENSYKYQFELTEDTPYVLSVRKNGTELTSFTYSRSDIIKAYNSNVGSTLKSDAAGMLIGPVYLIVGIVCMVHPVLWIPGIVFLTYPFLSFADFFATIWSYIKIG